MTGATPVEASRALREVLQQLLSCVTADVLVMDVEAAITRLMASCRLRRVGGSFVTLRFVHRFAVLCSAPGFLDRFAA